MTHIKITKSHASTSWASYGVSLLNMMTSSNGNISALLAIYAGNSPVPGEFPAQRPVTRSFDVFFDLRLNKRLSKQSWGWWFETLSPHYDVIVTIFWRMVALLSGDSTCAHNHKIIVVGNVLVDTISQWIFKQSCCSNMQSTHLLLGKHHIKALNSTDSPGQCDTDNTVGQYDTAEASTALTKGD